MGEFTDKLKGKAKQVEGDLTGNEARHAEGTADVAKGEAKGRADDIKRHVKDLKEDLKK